MTTSAPATPTVLDDLDHGLLHQDTVESIAHALASSRVRDAVLAHTVGHTGCARQILAGAAPAARWLIVGPIDPVQVRRLRPVLVRVCDAAALEGGNAHWAAVSIQSYLDWIDGGRLAATRRLQQVPADYSFAHLLRTLIASGQALPQVRPHDCCTRSDP